MSVRQFLVECISWTAPDLQIVELASGPRTSGKQLAGGLSAVFAGNVIDDVNGVTLAAASTLDKEAKIKAGGNVAAAGEVGKLVAERAKKAGVSEVVFDRGSYIYHGRIKALADAAREGGLSF